MNANERALDVLHYLYSRRADVIAWERARKCLEAAGRLQPHAADPTPSLEEENSKLSSSLATALRKLEYYELRVPELFRKINQLLGDKS